MSVDLAPNAGAPNAAFIYFGDTDFVVSPMDNGQARLHVTQHGPVFFYCSAQLTIDRMAELARTLDSVREEMEKQICAGQVPGGRRMAALNTSFYVLPVSVGQASLNICQKRGDGSPLFFCCVKMTIESMSRLARALDSVREEMEEQNGAPPC